MTLRELWKDIPDARVVSPISYANEDTFFRPPPEDSEPVDAKLLEGSDFLARPIRPKQSEFTHFLDGSQKALRCGYFGMMPVFLAHTSAAIVERCERQTLASGGEFYSGSTELVATADVPCPPELSRCVIEKAELGKDPSHEEPISKRISLRREDRETELGQQFQGGVLLVDGGIGKILRPNSTELIVGIVKSHQKKYFESESRVRVIMDLREGERTSVFERAGVKLERPAASFYVRLRADNHQGPLFGLIRVEMPLRDDYVARADEIAGWILHERAPLSLPDGRFDRMLYPVRLVEKYLKARQPSDAAMRAIVGL